MNNTNEMPLSMRIEELKKSIAQVVNDSKLPPCVIDPIIEGIYNEVRNAHRQEYENDRKKYEEKNAEETSDVEKVVDVEVEE